MNQKGMSPLIATVVLISFAVSLGAVIMTWSSRMIMPESNKTTECIDLSLGVYKYQTGDYDACYSDDEIIFTVESYRGKVPGLKLVALTSGRKLFSVPNVLEKTLSPDNPQKIVVPYNVKEYGELKELKFFPLLGRKPDLHICDNAPFTVGPISRCQ